jgi:amidase
MTEERAASEAEMAASTRAIELFGDEAVKRNRRGTLKYSKLYNFKGYIRALARRATIQREWQAFLEKYRVLVMPVSWMRPFPIDFDQRGDDVVSLTHYALQPSIAVSLMGVPGLAVPITVDAGAPIGVQIVAARFQEETCLTAAEAIEARTSAGKLPIEPSPAIRNPAPAA